VAALSLCSPAALAAAVAAGRVVVPGCVRPVLRGSSAAVARFGLRFGAVVVRVRWGLSAGRQSVSLVFPSRARALRFAGCALWGRLRGAWWFGGRLVLVRGRVVVVWLRGA
jgi:hypothetical protein